VADYFMRRGAASAEPWLTFLTPIEVAETLAARSLVVIDDVDREHQIAREFWHRFDQLSSRAARFSATPSASSESTPSTEKTSADSRPVYRYSVIPGGVRTPEELIEAMASDSTVAGHYAGIDKAHLTTARLSEPLQAHVSYRIGDRVYWTKRKVTIQAGEQIVTAGVNSLAEGQPVKPEMDGKSGGNSLVQSQPLKTAMGGK